MIFLTGGTGFLGQEILTRLLAQEKQVALLVRPEKEQSAEARVHHLLKDSSVAGALERGQVKVVAGDVTLPFFGLGESQFDALATDVRSIFHSAASTSLNQTLEDARTINVAGTQNVLEFANRTKKESFDCFYHISTAYVAGDVERVVTADELNLSHSFRNSYEQTKAEAEAIVRGAITVPTCVFRPSVIVGDSVTGVTTSFSMLYIPARLIVQGILSALPASHTAPFDVVPVNYVADAIVSLSSMRRTANAYHLSAGIGRESSPWEILECLIKTFNMYRERGLRALHMPERFSAEMLTLIHHSLCVARTGLTNLEKLFTSRLSVLKQVLPFFPYMIRNPRFDSTATVRDLGSELALPPLFTNYSERLFKYCLDTNWGKITPPVATSASFV